MGDANYEYVKKQEARRRQPDYYEKNYLDENPVLINANINVGQGRTVVVPIHLKDNVHALAHNVCKMHQLGDISAGLLEKVLEDYRDKALGKTEAPSHSLTSLLTQTKAVAKLKQSIKR
jgi:hypothetical protein